jgi:PadR family transcriptional regulator, regulatory protein PadR
MSTMPKSAEGFKFILVTVFMAMCTKEAQEMRGDIESKQVRECHYNLQTKGLWSVSMNRHAEQRTRFLRPMTTAKTSPSSETDAVTREILLSFWKVHILHHAAESPIYGQWIADELRRHGYRISPGTLYPLLKRMEENGWLKCTRSRNASAHARKEYRLTKEGEKILAMLRAHVQELHDEVVEEARERRQR